LEALAVAGALALVSAFLLFLIIQAFTAEASIVRFTCGKKPVQRFVNMYKISLTDGIYVYQACQATSGRASMPGGQA
jgi:hypothetical protein